MKNSYAALCAASFLVAGACDPSDDPTWEVDLRVQTKEEVIETLVMNTCGREDACGAPTTSCRLTAGQQRCTGTNEPSDYSSCAEEYRSALEDTLDGCPLNRTTRQLMEDCVNPGLSEACVSNADPERILSGSKPARPSQPEACSQLFDIEWADCGAPR